MEAWLKPMLCDLADAVPDGDDDWIIERKLDGWRAVAHRTPNRVRLYGGRNGSEYTGKLPYIEAVLNRLPEDTAVDGELVAPDGWGSVQGTMTRGGTAPHEPTAASPPLRFVLFDVLKVQGQDVRKLPWRERRAMLVAAGFNGPLVFTSASEPSEVRVYQQFLDEGHEGAVAKHVESKYVAGKSHHSWVKVKPTLTGEAVIRGFKPGTPGSDFDGTLGALELEMLDENDQPNGVLCKAGSGLDRDLRDLIWGDQDAFRGRFVEIRYQELGPTGIPRFPRFLRMRDDKQHAPPKPAPAPAAPPRPRASGVKPRNYGAMTPENLRSALADFDRGYGDAIDVANAKGRDLADEERRCRDAARKKGIS